jgi:class 3 adenylate cyclase
LSEAKYRRETITSPETTPVTSVVPCGTIGSVSPTETFVFTDIEDSTGRAGRLGDSTWSSLLRRHNEILAEIVMSHGGREVKKTGDGAMLVFEDPVGAVRCVKELQGRMRDIGLPVRAGVHCGEAISDGTDYIGVQIHIAARVGALAVGDELLVSAAARHEIGDEPFIDFGPPRTVVLRGVEGLHRVYPVIDAVSATPPFVGRDNELRQLHAAFDDVRSGSRRVVAVTGTAGVGKSRLLQEFCRQLASERSVQFHWGRCWEREGSPAYLPFMEIVRSLVSSDSKNVPAILGHIIPELIENSNPLPRLPDDPDGARAVLFNAVSDLLIGAAARVPQVAVLEDMHRCDPMSFALFQHVIEATLDHRVLLLVTIRDEGEDGDAVEHALAMRGEHRVLKLGPIGQDDVASYLAFASGESPDTSTIHAVMTLTEGIPFNLTQIAPLVHDRGAAALPSSVRSSIRTRVNALSADASWLLEVASVFGNAFDLDVLSRAAGISRSQSLSALDEATAARLLEWDGRSSRAEFSHQLLQGAIYERVAIGRRAVVHGQIGRALEAVLTGDDLSSCSEKAYHFVQALPAGFASEALEQSRRAARMAASARAHEDAAQHLRNALDAWASLAHAKEQTRLELMGELSSQEIALGRRAEGWLYMEQTIEPALELGEVELAATTALGWMSEWAPASPRSDDILERILEALPLHSELCPQIRALLAVWRSFQDDPGYRETADLAWREAQATRNPAITTKVFSMIGLYDPERFTGEQLIRLGEDLGDSGYVGLGWRNVGRARLDRGDSTGAAEAFSMAATLADSVGSPLPRADARWRLAGIAVNHGNENGARRWMAEAATFEARGNAAAPRLVDVALEFVLARNACRIAELVPFISVAEDTAIATPLISVIEPLLAMVALAGGETHRAERVLSSLPVRPFPGGRGYWELAACAAAELALGLSDMEAMAQLEVGLRGSLDRTVYLPGSSAIFTHVAETAAMLALARGSVGTARELLAVACDRYTSLEALPLISRVNAVIDLVASGGLPNDGRGRAHSIATAAGLPVPDHHGTSDV